MDRSARRSGCLLLPESCILIHCSQLYLILQSLDPSGQCQGPGKRAEILPLQLSPALSCRFLLGGSACNRRFLLVSSTGPFQTNIYVLLQLPYFFWIFLGLHWACGSLSWVLLSTKVPALLSAVGLVSLDPSLGKPDTLLNSALRVYKGLLLSYHLLCYCVVCLTAGTLLPSKVFVGIKIRFGKPIFMINKLDSFKDYISMYLGLCLTPQLKKEQLSDMIQLVDVCSDCYGYAVGFCVLPPVWSGQDKGHVRSLQTVRDSSHSGRLSAVPLH